MIEPVFGPVPSRRLGNSLGVNNIPPKHCSYACVYCQLGSPQHVLSERRPFKDPLEIATVIAGRVDELDRQGALPDFVTIVPDGEPLLDSGIGTLLTELQKIKRRNPRCREIVRPRIAVITNGSLLHHAETRRELRTADWISVKVDAPDDALWRKIDRPSRNLDFDTVLEGLRAFREEFTGFLATETMLVSEVNDDTDTLRSLASLISTIKPDISYLSIPTRPPAEEWVSAPEEERILQAYRIFADAQLKVELNTGYETGSFGITGKLEDDVLSTAAVHPIPEPALKEMVVAAKETWKTVESLLKRNLLLRKEYRGRTFYLTNLKR